MFDSLVESGSHKDDLARKGSFLLGTLVVYGILGVAIVIGGIYWANASIPDPSLELLTLVAPVPMAATPEVKQEQKADPKPASSKEPQVSMRQEISVIAPVVKSNEVAKETTKEVKVARTVNMVVGNRDIDAPPSAGPPGPMNSTGGGGGGGGTGIGTGPVAPPGDEPPPPPPAPKPTPPPPPKPKTVVSGGVLNGKAISKPQPPYPAIAKAARAQGQVTVQILVDESGRVVSANAVGGHPLLQQAAVSAARQARFSPTLLSGQAVKVSGVITYNFVLQ
ncbi:MAG TPA: energy transducer TonB [Pyrinomonadaceae bacterium]|jgi:protein TonB|nr:energy transducer TonB [Pyrinomonadaceae bacterium]